MELFICPASTDSPAVQQADGNTALDPASNSYTWVSQRTGILAPLDTPLASDDDLRHAAGRDEEGLNVLYVGMTAEWISRRALPRGSRFPAGLVDNSGRPGL